MLAKLCGGLHKPNQQTVLLESAVTDLLDPLPVDRLRGFGGKLGDLLKRGKPDIGIHGFESIGSLRRAGEATVAQVLRGEWRHPEEKATLACQMASGRDDAVVEQRPFAKQIGGGKNFNGSRILENFIVLEGWLHEFAGDVWERLEEEEDVNERIATQLVVHVSVDGWKSGRSKRCKLRPGVKNMVADAMSMMRQLLVDRPAQNLAIVGVGLSADSFIGSVAKAEIGALKRMFEKKSQGLNTNEILNHRNDVGDQQFELSQDIEVALRSSSKTTTRRMPAEQELATITELQTQLSNNIAELSSREPHGEDRSDISDSSDPVIIDISQDCSYSNPSAAMTSGRWSCSVCTFRNESISASCEVCQTPRTKMALSFTAISKPRSRSRKVRGRKAGSEQKCQKSNGIAALLLKSGRSDRLVVEV